MSTNFNELMQTEEEIRTLLRRLKSLDPWQGMRIVPREVWENPFLGEQVHKAVSFEVLVSSGIYGGLMDLEAMSKSLSNFWQAPMLPIEKGIRKDASFDGNMLTVTRSYTYDGISYLAYDSIHVHRANETRYYHRKSRYP